MIERPLLFFPNKENATRSKLQTYINKIATPSSLRQAQRLSPKFQQLYDILNKQSIEVQQTPDGINPEQVLVFETVCSVEEFSKAVSTIQGLEWLSEIEIEELLPDDDFYLIDEKGEKVEKKPMTGRLYLIFTNTSAMNQLISLWNLWLKNPNFNCRSGENRGKGKFKEVFKYLKNIRKWDINDRYEEFRIVEFWEENLQIDPHKNIRFEIELWYRLNPSQKLASYQSVRNLIYKLNGRVITSCDIPEISYHAILAEVPAKEIQNIISHNDSKLIKCENIMYFKPSGQIIVNEGDYEIGTQSIDVNDKFPLPTGEPIVGIFDGYPLTKHAVLNDRLIVDDPDNFEEYYQVKDRIHGTAMCSLIVRGDLNSNDIPITTPLYVRPIMRPNEFNRMEFVPDNILIVDTVHRAVKRMFDGNSSTQAVAPSVKIINISIGDGNRLFYSSMSPWSKLLDWLAYKYKILFIISSGNHYNEIRLNMTFDEFKNLNLIEREKFFLREIINNSRNCRIMSPAESINNLCVGALHFDNSQILQNDHRLNPYSSTLPATYSALGSGYRKSIKPDLVYYGGRQMYDYKIGSNSVLYPTLHKSPPGLLVAAPDSTLNKTLYERGTSIAAALISRSGHLYYNVLNELIHETQCNIPSDLISVIIKAMIIHGCSWDEIGYELDRRLNGYSIDLKKIKSRLIGYGLPNLNKVVECTAQRATVIGFGELNEEEAHLYCLPLPPSLESKTIKRRLTITLAWYTPISSSTQRYRTARLWFESKNDIVKDRINNEYHSVRRGTVQHEIFEGSSASAFVEGNSIMIKVNCSKDAKSFTEGIPYSIIVSLEVAENLNLPIYQEVKEKMYITVPVEQAIY